MHIHEQLIAEDDFLWDELRCRLNIQLVFSIKSFSLANSFFLLLIWHHPLDEARPSVTRSLGVLLVLLLVFKNVIVHYLGMRRKLLLLHFKSDHDDPN